MNEQTPGSVKGWENILNYHSKWSGIKFDVPPNFRDLSRYAPNTTQADRLTGIATETDAMRTMLIQNLTNCVREKKRWAMLYADGDQLKTANDKYNRKLGDFFIKWTTSHVTSSLEGLPNYLQDKAVVVRPRDSSDEVQVWFFDVSDEDLVKITEVKDKIGKTEKKLRGPGITFSVSTSLLHSGHEDIGNYEAEWRAVLAEKPDALLGKFYEFIGFKGDEIVKEMKLNKELFELSGFTQRQLTQATDMQAFIEAVRRHYGGKRNSGELLKTVQQMNTIYFIKSLERRLPGMLYRNILKYLGLTAEEIQSANTVSALLSIYSKLFPSDRQKSQMQQLASRLQELSRQD